MLKGAASKALWAAKAMALFWGAALTLALMLGLASAAFAGNGPGAVFNLGKNNTVDRTSQLRGSTSNGPNLRILNDGTQAALALRVGDQQTPPAQKTVAPMRVDSQVKVNNLNADALDGRSASSFADGTNGVADNAQNAANADNATNADDAALLQGNPASAFLGSGVVVRTEEDDLQNGAASAAQTALCGAGEVATGGGSALVLDGAGEGADPVNGEFVIAASRPVLADGPSEPPTGWQASVLDFDADQSNSGLFTLRVYAVCAPQGG